MLGSQENANKAAEYRANVGDHNDFTYLGAGGSRVAYLGPDGIVYKVGYSSDGSQADDEEEFFDVLRSYGVPWVPETTLYEVEIGDDDEFENYAVTAMPLFHQPWGDDIWDNGPEFLAAKNDPKNRERWREMQAIVTQDLKSANVGVDENGLLFLLDGGVESSEYVEDVIRRNGDGSYTVVDEDEITDDEENSEVSGCDCQLCNP